MLMMAFWNKEIQGKTICIPVLLEGMEVIVLDSKESSPLQELSGEEKRIKAFVSYDKNTLMLSLFNPKALEYIFECKQSIKSIDGPKLFADPRNIYIKNVILEGNQLEIEFGINRTLDGAITICLIIGSMILFGVCINKF